jgi:cytoskeleton protein RodZ
MTELESDVRTQSDDGRRDAADGDAASDSIGSVAGSDDASSQSAVGDSPPPSGFGHTLAQARQRLGLSVADVAARLRLHPRQISALEDEQLAALPEAPFVRGFVRNYAKEMQLDPAPLLADLAARLPAAAALGDPLASAGISHADVRRAGVEGKSRVTVVGGAVVVLIVLGLIGWLASSRTPTGESAKAQPSVSAADPQPAAPAPAGSAAALAVPDSSNPPGPASLAQGTAVTDNAPAAADSAAPAAELATPPAAGTSPPVLNGVRLLIGDRPSWIEITQADGAVILSGLQEPGTERRLAPVQPPLRLVIGNSSAVRLEYRGKPIDLTSYARADDLARLTLE